jgi:uncharacterized YkwD family protein
MKSMGLKVIAFALFFIIAVPTYSFSAPKHPSVVINGKKLAFDVPPTIINGTSMVPVRGVMEALGAEVNWNAKGGTVLIKKEDTTIRLTLGQKIAYKNDQGISLSTVPQIIKYRTFVPLRFISESIGAAVSWEEQTRTIFIQYVSGEHTPSLTTGYELEVTALVNAERTKAGLKPLKYSEPLAKVARVKSADMYENSYFGHVSPTFGTPFDMLDKHRIPYQFAGENIAKGHHTPEEVVQSWMNSEGHRKNILNANYNQMGVGFYNHFWTQQFVGN